MRDTRARRWRRAAASVVVLMVAGLVGPDVLPARAEPCVMEPQLRDITANQGVGSYTTVARGKVTLVRLYLSLPSCAPAGSSITVTGTSLTANNGSGLNLNLTPFSPAPSVTPPAIAAYSLAPALDSAADPKFVIPGTYLSPSYTTARFDVTFTATVNYQAKASSGAAPVAGTKMFDRLSGSVPPLKVTVEKKTNALRLLVVPMGDGRKSYASQFNPFVDLPSTQKGLTNLARLLPVPDGTGDLKSFAGGVRYTIAPTLLDVSSLMNPLTGKFCGKSTNWETLKPLLSQFLVSWNTANAANPAATADRVLGVVSENISLGGNSSCAEGYATVGGNQAWVRAIADTEFVPSMTGALMAMEIAHTMGVVPTSRDDDSNARHSLNTAAETTNRAYNVAKRAFVSNDRSAMKLFGTWNNTNVLFEAADWAFIQCKLGGATNAECGVAGAVGTNVGVGADPTFVISGRTDGTPVGTDIVESYYAPGAARFDGDPFSIYRLAQRDGATILRDDGVEVAFEDSDHGDGPEGQTSAVGVFSAAFPFDTGANSIELWKGQPDGPTSVLLYSRDRTVPPTLTSVTAEPPSGGTSATERASVDSAEAQATAPINGSPSVSADGRFVAFSSQATNMVPGDTNGLSDAFVRDRQAGTTERVSVSDSEAQATGGGSTQPVISGDGRYVAFVSGATNLVAGDTNAQFDIFVRDRLGGTTTRVSVATGGAEANNSSNHPSISDDGNRVAFTSLASNLVAGDTNGVDDVFVHYGTTGVTERVSATTSGTAAITATSGAVVEVAAPASVRPNAAESDDNIIAFDEQLGDAPSAVVPAGGLNVDASTPGTYDRTHALTPSTIAAGTQVKTHLLHADRPGAPVDLKLFTGTASFDADILGVVVLQNHLEASDSLGSVGTLYPVPNDPVLQGLRGLDFVSVPSSNDSVTISADRRTLTVTFEVQNIMDEVRVVTQGDTVQGNGLSDRPDLSGDGRYVAFHSIASNLVPSDGNSVYDVFLRDLQLDITERVGLTNAGGSPNSTTQLPAVSRGGRYVAFQSSGSNLVTGDTNGTRDIFVRDRQAGTTERVSVTSAGAQTGGGGSTSDVPAISDDGRYVAFQSSATDLVTGDTNAQFDAFRRDRQTGTTVRISVSSAGAEATGGATFVDGSHLSADGRIVVFSSSTTNLVTGDTNGAFDAFARDQAPPAAGQQPVTWRSTDDFPGDLRGSLLYTCPDGTVYPVAVGLRPESLAGATASFERNFDAALACEGGSLNVAINDGFTRVTPNPINDTPVVSGPKAPTAATETPAGPADVVSQFDSVALKGSGKDPETGELTGTALEWSLTVPGGSPTVVGTGDSVDLAPPVSGWAPGTYTVRLKATDPAGATDTEDTTFRVRVDCRRRVCSNGNPADPGVVHRVTLSKSVSLRVNKPNPCSTNYGPTCDDPAGSATTVSAPAFAGDPGASFQVMLCNAQALAEPNADGSGGGGDVLGGCDYGNGVGLGPLGVPNSGTLTLDAGGNLAGSVNLEMPSGATLTPLGGGTATNLAAVCPPTPAQILAGWTCIVHAAEYDPLDLQAPPLEASYRQVFLKSPIPAMTCGGVACPASIPTGTSVTLTGVQFPCRTITPDDPMTIAYDGACTGAWTNKTILLKRVSTSLIEGAAIVPSAQTSALNGGYTITFTMPAVAAPGETYKIVPHAPTCTFPCESGQFNAAGKFFRHA